jgi:MoaA/NifB/PqqE/SkfB family radical SAM enzyme
MRLIDDIARFGPHSPVLVFTGGDPFMRVDLFDLAERARSHGLPIGFAPSVTPLLTRDAVTAMREVGAKTVSISLDGAFPATHEGIRGVKDHFRQTEDAVRMLVEEGLTVQINTTVMRRNANELADVAALVQGWGAHIWEVFFLIRVGRGVDLEELEPAENEDVVEFLYDASRYGFIVRTVEAPFFRRVVLSPRAQSVGTRDGKGILFVSHAGEVYPSGFLPLRLGDVRVDDIVQLYRESAPLQAIRGSAFTGRCGACAYSDLCGGSRARAFAASRDPLGEDPACAYDPAALAGASA